MVQCCNPEINGGGGWGIFNALFGWQNSATYGSVISYNIYWLAVIIGFLLLRYNETHGHWPLMKPKVSTEDRKSSNGSSNEEEAEGIKYPEKAADGNGISSKVRTIEV